MGNPLVKRVVSAVSGPSSFRLRARLRRKVRELRAALSPDLKPSNDPTVKVYLLNVTESEAEAFFDTQDQATQCQFEGCNDTVVAIVLQKRGLDLVTTAACTDHTLQLLTLIQLRGTSHELEP